MGHDVPGVAESQIRQNSCETDGVGVAFYYERFKLSMIQTVGRLEIMS